MPPRPLEPGDPVRLGRFELLARLGEGGQGVVYLGRGSGPGEERVAVKVLRSSVDAHVMERLARELDAIHQVQPFVTAGIIEASAEGDRRYVVSEFIDGPTLQDRVETQGPLPERDLQRLAVGTATALTAIHGAGVVHRDFKPANVLLGPDGPRVVDFGIARLTDAVTITSGVIGTPAYVSPEQLAGERPSSAVDMFAWGVTMVFAATGRSAFGTDSVPAVMHRVLYEEPDLTGVPPSLRPAVGQCLAKDPALRPSARDLLLRLVDPSAPYPAQPGGSMRSAPANTQYPGPPPQYTQAPQYSQGSQYTQAPQYSQGSQYTPTGITPPVRSSRWSSGRIVALSGVAAVVVAVAVVAALLLTRGPSTAPAAGPAVTGTTSVSVSPADTASASSGKPSPSVSASPSSSPSTSSTATAGGVTIPASFAGTWSGTATMSALSNPGVGLPSSITFTFVAGATTAHETNGDCVNTLTLTASTATVLTFSEPQTASCVAGTDTFTLHSADIAYRWTDNVEQNVATLRQ
jgi:serine/threonine protein kinase